MERNHFPLLENSMGKLINQCLFWLAVQSFSKVLLSYQVRHKMNLDFTEKHIRMTTAYVIFIYLTSNPMALHNMKKEIQKPFLPLKDLRLPAATHHPVPIFHTASGTSSIPCCLAGTAFVTGTTQARHRRPGIEPLFSHLKLLHSHKCQARGESTR